MSSSTAIQLLASELYLLEKWSSFTGEAKERRAHIFKEYVAMGAAGRWPYYHARKFSNYAQPTPEQMDIDANARSPKERDVASMLSSGQETHLIWLRTFYGEGINPLASLGNQEITYATSDNWRQIMYLLPEVVDCARYCKDPARLSEHINEAKEEVGPELENEEEEESKADIRETVQGAWVTGSLWVQDKCTSESGEVLLVWLDEFGRSVRATTVEYDWID